MKENFPIRCGTNVSSSTSSALLRRLQLGLSLISLSAIFAASHRRPALLSRSFLMAMLG